VQNLHEDFHILPQYSGKMDWHEYCLNKGCTRFVENHRIARYEMIRRRKKRIAMRKKTAGIAASAVLAFGMLAAGPVSFAQSSAPCEVPGEGPRDGSGQGQGLRDGKGNGPRNGQGYGPKRGRAQGLRNGSGRWMRRGLGRGLVRRDGSCLIRGTQPAKTLSTTK
jgi:hypothetical protein